MRKKGAMIITLALIISAVNLAVLAIGDGTLGDNIARPLVPMTGDIVDNTQCNTISGRCDISNPNSNCTQYSANHTPPCE